MTLVRSSGRPADPLRPFFLTLHDDGVIGIATRMGPLLRSSARRPLGQLTPLSTPSLGQTNLLHLVDRKYRHHVSLRLIVRLG